MKRVYSSKTVDERQRKLYTTDAETKKKVHAHTQKYESQSPDNAKGWAICPQILDGRGHRPPNSVGVRKLE